jgi:hypothetical protein
MSAVRVRLPPPEEESISTEIEKRAIGMLDEYFIQKKNLENCK